MKKHQQDLTEPLNDEELRALDAFLLDRVDEESATPDCDEGVLDISELDGFLTAIVSLPELIPPSLWLSALWGEFPPEFESLEQAETVMGWLMRHMNGIAGMMMAAPAEFEPIFLEHEANGRVFCIVDEWCEGYMRAVRLANQRGDSLGERAEELMRPIRAFTQAENWPANDLPDPDTEKLQQSIAPAVRELHAYWLKRRRVRPPGQATPFRHTAAQVGRNDPCPCGSGKKFKKCCGARLH